MSKNILIAGVNSGTGKTTLSLGIMHALTQRGYSVQPFKVGPDYIDTRWHRLATGNASHNLDEYMLGSEKLLQLFEFYSQSADISIIEGVAGLFDGFSMDPVYCTSYGAALITKTPIILVLDAKASTTSVAAIVKGFLSLQKNVPIVGVILNRVNADYHYQWIKQAVETYCQVPVLGRLPNDETILLPERQLGLVHGDNVDLAQYWQNLNALIEQYIDLGQLMDLMIESKPSLKNLPLPKLDIKPCRVALAVDSAFHFYYQANLDLLRHYGVQIIEFSPIKDKALPACDAIYIGGGFPERFAEPLSANRSMHQSIIQAHQHKIPIYAECGGALYLAQSLQTEDGKVWPMVGITPLTGQMTQSLQNFGYTEAVAQADNLLAEQDTRLRGHEFHYARLEGEVEACYRHDKYRDGQAIKSWPGGCQVGSCFASFLHLHFYQRPEILMRWLG